MITIVGLFVVAGISFLLGFWLGKDKGYKKGLTIGRAEALEQLINEKDIK